MTDQYAKPTPAPALRADVRDIADALDGVGTRLAIDDETVAGGLYAVAAALDRLADTIADAHGREEQPSRR